MTTTSTTHKVAATAGSLRESTSIAKGAALAAAVMCGFAADAPLGMAGLAAPTAEPARPISSVSAPALAAVVTQMRCIRGGRRAAGLLGDGRRGQPSSPGGIYCCARYDGFGRCQRGPPAGQQPRRRGRLGREFVLCAHRALAIELIPWCRWRSDDPNRLRLNSFRQERVDGRRNAQCGQRAEPVSGCSRLPGRSSV